LGVRNLFDESVASQSHAACSFLVLNQTAAHPSRCSVVDPHPNWIELNRERVDPRGPLASGIGYYTNQREALHRFLDDGRIRLDNNWSEQQLRNLVLGLANWSFFANETGLRWYTTFRSLIASCALHRLNPEVYVEQLLRIVPHWPKHRVLELAPKYWLNTVAELEPRWRKILERPWEPGVVASAEIVPPGVRPADTTERERAASALVASCCLMMPSGISDQRSSTRSTASHTACSTT
jgi:hypothetical protein